MPTPQQMALANGLDPQAVASMRGLQQKPPQQSASFNAPPPTPQSMQPQGMTNLLAMQGGGDRFNAALPVWQTRMGLDPSGTPVGSTPGADTSTRFPAGVAPPPGYVPPTSGPFSGGPMPPGGYAPPTGYGYQPISGGMPPPVSQQQLPVPGNLQGYQQLPSGQYKP